MAAVIVYDEDKGLQRFWTMKIILQSPARSVSPKKSVQTFQRRMQIKKIVWSTSH